MTRSVAIRTVTIMPGLNFERGATACAWTVTGEQPYRVGVKVPKPNSDRSARTELGRGDNFAEAVEMAAAKVAGRPVRPAETAKAEEGLTRRLAERIATATVGYDRYLNGPNDALYWSPYKDDDERDNGPEGAATYANPAAALTAVVLNVGRLVVPEGIEGPQFEEASQ